MSISQVSVSERGLATMGTAESSVHFHWQVCIYYLCNGMCSSVQR